ncbi:hypothetical protein KCP77_11550 [Salmonella enterica subsp. enterica]|nr:hypothetical protein KCP77_11550 [Salmonella enterica subsp. enterica]
MARHTIDGGAPERRPPLHALPYQCHAASERNARCRWGVTRAKISIPCVASTYRRHLYGTAIACWPSMCGSSTMGIA